jgi:hypothetical protein
MKHVARKGDMQIAHKIYVGWGHCACKTPSRYQTQIFDKMENS